MVNSLHNTQSKVNDDIIIIIAIKMLSSHTLAHSILIETIDVLVISKVFIKVHLVHIVTVAVWPTETCCLHKNACDFMFMSTGLQLGS